MLQYSLRTAHQRVSADKYAVLVDTLPQLLVVSWLLLGLVVPEYLLEEGIWNRLASHALVEELANRGGLQEVVRLTGLCNKLILSLFPIQDKVILKKHRPSYIAHDKGLLSGKASKG